MKTVILAGGLGTRIAEESDHRPKPMIEIGGRPLLWHIMKLYAFHGVNDFIVCLGYKGYAIKEYFFNYRRHTDDMIIDLASGGHQMIGSRTEDWKITLVDTGVDTMTGGRLRRIAPLLGDETFLFTYGDGLSDVDISLELQFHRRHGKLATVAAVQPPGRFGVLNVDDEDRVSSFEEKPSTEIGWINGGFFVLEPRAITYVDGDRTSWERAPLERMAQDGELMAFRHHGFWQPCDTLRDKRILEELWNDGNGPWCVWNRR